MRAPNVRSNDTRKFLENLPWTVIDRGTRGGGGVSEKGVSEDVIVDGEVKGDAARRVPFIPLSSVRS